jgi:hypothetical protein
MYCMTQYVVTNDEAITVSIHFFRLLLILFKGMEQTLGVLMS